MIRKIIGILAAIFIFIAVIIQFIPYGHNHTNPPVLAEPKWDSETTRATFYRTCGDCHSNQTTWLWYSNIAPVSWLVYHDVQEGRSRFNVSEWGRPGENEGEAAAELVKSGEMPLPQYLLMHPNARLTPQEKDAFIKGLIATFGGGGGD
ncbi:MAG: heme-binding domain-containing protein [Anaerolineales bacterium]